MYDRIWLKHPDIADPFHCPVDAAQAWQARGWEPCDEPAQPNPALAEQTPASAPAAESSPPTVAQPKSKKPRGDTAVESTQGVNDVG